MSHYLQYWKTYNFGNGLHEPLHFAMSAQFKKIRPGDILWIVAIKKHRLNLLGKLVVGQVISRKKAVMKLGNQIYDAPLCAVAKLGTEEAILETDIQTIASTLRFNSPRDRLFLPDPARTDGKQLQTLRELTPSTTNLLQEILDSGASLPKVLFARVGWMKLYAGPQAGDEKPVGGGRNNLRTYGEGPKFWISHQPPYVSLK